MADVNLTMHDLNTFKQLINIGILRGIYTHEIAVAEEAYAKLSEFLEPFHQEPARFPSIQLPEETTPLLGPDAPGPRLLDLE